MTDLTLSDSGRFYTAQDAAPSYFEYHARRTLPGDKKLAEYRKLLNRWYLAADVEHILRGMIKRGYLKGPYDNYSDYLGDTDEK